MYCVLPCSQSHIKFYVIISFHVLFRAASYGLDTQRQIYSFGKDSAANVMLSRTHQCRRQRQTETDRRRDNAATTSATDVRHCPLQRRRCRGGLEIEQYDGWILLESRRRLLTPSGPSFPFPLVSVRARRRAHRVLSSLLGRHRKASPHPSKLTSLCRL